MKRSFRSALAFNSEQNT